MPRLVLPLRGISTTSATDSERKQATFPIGLGIDGRDPSEYKGMMSCRPFSGSRRPAAYPRGIQPTDLRRVQADPSVLSHRTQLQRQDLNDTHVSQTARHVPERLLRSLPCLIQTIRMDVFFFWKRTQGRKLYPKG